ncbi:MAG: UbiX family flavin prenyltransferase [Armatimonadetes bacterium]|jgi:4-hydroxy-3-polyprenylbenzoate decarboxylase|nr:UbiX family flavin prenyltransferase [Armatimonadota bacterium]
MVAISGASGAAYAARLLQLLPEVYNTIYLTASESAMGIIRRELGSETLSQVLPKQQKSKFQLLSSTDLGAPPASGSHNYDGLIVIPCSMGALGRIAAGVSDDLITRSADVCLKERRKLILVVRETPLNLIQLRSMTTLAEAGAVILPACPAFYSKPKEISDLVDFVVDRVLQLMGIDIGLTKGWGE